MCWGWLVRLAAPTLRGRRVLYVLGVVGASSCAYLASAACAVCAGGGWAHRTGSTSLLACLHKVGHTYNTMQATKNNDTFQKPSVFKVE